MVALSTGCAVDESDLQRWETTLGGPRRLSAVVLHEKYPHALRVEAAVSLIRMKPRKGKHVGIERLVKGALVCDAEFDDPDEPCAKKELTPEERAALLADLVPIIIAELKQPPPPPAQKGQSAPDPSFRFKDAAYLMLTYEKTQVVADAAVRQQLIDALIEWAMADFDRRLNERAQAFGMEQLLRHIGAKSVEKLPTLMTKDGKNLAKMADIIDKIANQETKEEASKQLVMIAEHTASDEWRKSKEPELREANRVRGFEPTEKQFAAQLEQFQNESVVRVFADIKKVGGQAAVKYGLEVAANEKLDVKRRQTAMAALEGHINRKDDAQIKALFDIAGNPKTPGEVLDQAFRRIKELPRDKVIEQLYGFFESSDWKLRRLAGATVLSMSEVKHIDEFMDALAKRATKNFNLPEAITYGAYLGALKEGDPAAKLEPHMRSGPPQVRMSAISYFYDFGTKHELNKLDPFLNDGTKAPTCEEEAGCDWTCLIDDPEAPKPKPANEGEEKKEPKEGEEAPQPKKVAKEVNTVGDFVRYCIRPKVEKTDKKKETDKDAKKGQDTKGTEEGKKEGGSDDSK